MKNFILASRPKTLLAGVVPPLVSYAYFFSEYKRHEFLYLILCLIGVMAIQIATNFFNDVIDHQKGADKKRVGPTRVSASGLVDIKTVKSWAISMVTIAFLCGVPIIIRGGVPFLILGLISLYLTYGYTGGKISLAYRGLGELFVFLFFGLFSSIGSYYLYADGIDQTHLPKVIVLGCIFGCLTNTFIMVNNLRDRETDTEVGKRTLATKMTLSGYRRLALASIFVPYVLLWAFVGYGLLPIMVLGLFVAFKMAMIILRNTGAALNEGLKFAGIHLLAYSILIAVVFLYGHPVHNL